MNPSSPSRPTIVLATDRSARCDRALEAATRLARAFGNGAIAVSVVEASSALLEEAATSVPTWYQPPSPRVRTERGLHADLDATGLTWTALVLDDAHALSSELAQAQARAGDGGLLVVSGPVRDGAFGAARLGSTLDRLLRTPSARVLIVRQHSVGHYRHALVASDFSAPSKRALQSVRALFPSARLSLLHGFDVPLLGFAGDGRDELLARTRLRLQDEARAFLHDAGMDPAAVELVIEYGDPARLMRLYCDTFDPDLVACGTHGRGALVDLVIGSVARDMAMRAPVDTLLVRA